MNRIEKTTLPVVSENKRKAEDLRLFGTEEKVEEVYKKGGVKGIFIERMKASEREKPLLPLLSKDHSIIFRSKSEE
ncbi:MAG: hypothetical protein JSS09_01095 [Verrucomicrobia bacterium]|nr:hypothetical protein [Verrucomicrobiota bacterium]